MPTTIVASERRTSSSAAPLSAPGVATTANQFSLTDSSEDDDSDDDRVTNVRNVRLSNNNLLRLALEAAQAIDWSALSSPPSDAWTIMEKLPRPAVRRARSTGFKPLASPPPPCTSIFTHEETDSRFAAMAHTTVSSPLSELTPMFEASTSAQFSDVMQAIHGDALVSAELVHHVATDKSLSSNTSSSGLLVKAVLLDTSKTHHSDSSNAVSKFFFRSRRQRSNIEEWCYIDFVQRIGAKVVRKTLFSLDPSHLAKIGNGTDKSTEASEKLRAQGIERAGYLFEELDDGKSTRVSFWGEHVYSHQREGRLTRANQTIASRLLRLAESIDRFVLVVRRRRLGMQVMVDQIQVQASNTSCACCNKSFLLARKNGCDLCGYNVCSKCSQMEDREHRTPDGDARLSVSSRVRICDKCLARVDQCDFRHATLEDLSPPQIYSDPSPTSIISSESQPSPVTTGKLLGDLLREMLQNAPATKVAPVLNIIKHLVSHESRERGSSSSLITDTSTEQQHFDALASTLRDPSLPLSGCKLASRSYLIHHSQDAGVSHPHPVPSSEARRLEIIRSSKLTSLENIDELDIICSIISKELKCLGALISIAEADSIHVLATNIDFIPMRSLFPRNEGFCSSTIMSVDPLLVPHPETDVRFSYILPVKQLDVSFYCGYPLFAEDFTVLGSLCCLSYASCRLTQSQFTVGKKLAEAASRILQHHMRLRQNRTDVLSLEGLRSS